MSLSSRQCHHPYIDNNTTILESTKMSPFLHQHPCIDDNVTILASVMTPQSSHWWGHHHHRWLRYPLCINYISIVDDVTVLPLTTMSLSLHQWWQHHCPRINDVTMLASMMSPSLQQQQCHRPCIDNDITVSCPESVLSSMMTSLCLQRQWHHHICVNDQAYSYQWWLHDTLFFLFGRRPW